MSDLEFQEVWQIDVGGEVYEADFEIVTQWIAEGAVLRGDKVRRGNLRWLEAGKVPLLLPFFNAKDSGIEPPPIPVSAVNTVNPTEKVQTRTENFDSQQSFVENKPESETFNSPFSEPAQEFGSNVTEFQQPANSCAVHPGEEPKYLCESCQNVFCKACPKSYGGSVKVCPMCGAMCKSIAEAEQKRRNEFQYQTASKEGFGFSDFGRALAHPFKYKTSLFVGAIMFMFFTLGQSASALGGFFMVGASLFCLMSANMLTFGVLANTVENFSQGKLETNFMPDFDDFSLWDDMVHPFFLSIGVYISSFGPLILTVIIGAFLMVSAVSSEMKSIPFQPAENMKIRQEQKQFLTGEKLKNQSEEVKRLLERKNAEKAPSSM
ncbi:MAG TPA: B-box zinc finger protein, partial [Pyrinomonadaceae bacterium]|nr:B-box zinc finger protein [Pyrinomonadaceae bacterium]